uniref:Chondroadherin-like protein n=1 Tax=Cyprinodon variegatus TaxID=28743 RepID=A0A3Q2GGU0_CYPVA
MQFPAVVFLLTLALSSTIKARKCPKECSCDDAKLTVACIGKNLTEIPLGVQEITVKLDLKNNNFRILPRGGFLHTPHLTHLSLQRCNIFKVKEGAFRGLGRVVSLNLAYNKIDILYQESFDGLSSLKELHLDHNHIEEIQPGAFMQLGFLNMLTLAHNRLVYIPNMAFQGLQNIKWLRLSYNSLSNLAPEAFAGLFSLRRLSLDHNELQLREVKRLELSYNPITYLGEESVSMGKLTHLYLDHMSLQDLSDQAFSQARLLSHVDLGHNQLRYLEPFSGPAKLHILNLTGNPIYCDCYMRPLKEWATAGVKLLGACAGPPHLSDEPLQAVSPSDLRCRSRAEALEEEEEEKEEEESNGNITTTAKPKQTVKCPHNCECDVTHHATCESRGYSKVPRGFPAGTQLLDLRGNHFHYIPSSSFPGTSQVVSLHLEFCKIREIEGGAFQGMRNLLYLYLSHNDITFLDPKAFAGVPKLTYLHLDGNRLTRFPGAALSLLPNLFILHLEGNAISKLEPLSSAAPTLMELYLGNNTISVIDRGILSSSLIKSLHLDSNQLSQVPTDALAEAQHLEDLNLSRNVVRQLGPKTFQNISQNLKRLYMDQMGIEKISKEALLGLGPGLKVLSVRGNQLKELPDLSALAGLEMIDMQDNPLLCDCSLLPLRRWMESVKLEVSATCSHPLELRGQQVGDTTAFATCPGNTERVAVRPRPVKIKSSGEKPRLQKPQLAKLPRNQHPRKTGKHKKTKNKKINRGN